MLRTAGGTTSRYWYVLDGRGNVVAPTDTTGNVVNRYAYDIWGQPTSVSESVPQRLRYAGYWYDQELSWYWVGVRLYDPGLKSWLQPDPSQTEGVRTYAKGRLLQEGIVTVEAEAVFANIGRHRTLRLGG